MIPFPGVVDFVQGPSMSGGVFITVRSSDARVAADLRYLKVTRGPEERRQVLHLLPALSSLVPGSADLGRQRPTSTRRRGWCLRTGPLPT